MIFRMTLSVSMQFQQSFFSKGLNSVSAVNEEIHSLKHEGVFLQYEF